MSLTDSQTQKTRSLRPYEVFRAANVTVFCKVIDNLGDVGVAWRLARQLADEAHAAVSFVVDDLGPFSVIEPVLDRTRAWQQVNTIEVFTWHAFKAGAALERNADDVCLVIEAFGASPSEPYHERVAARQKPPVWINLEYLSAEDWVDGVHELPSPHPRLPLLRHFFCPGFSERSGGLIREASVQRASEATSSTRESRTVRALAFTYPNAPLGWVYQGFSSVLSDVTLVSPGKPSTDASVDEPQPAAFALEHVPTVPQPEFDAFLNTFDVLLVRGEDSFVRAQLAAKPMLWHIYQTDDRAHVVKLDAWLARYCEGLPPALERVVRRANYALIGELTEESSVAAFEDFARHLCDLRAHAVRWQQRLFDQDDLLTQLGRFYARQRST